MPSKNSCSRENESTAASGTKGSKTKGSKSVKSGSKGHEDGRSCSRDGDPGPSRGERRVNEHTPLLEQVRQEQHGRDDEEDYDGDSCLRRLEDELDFAFPPEGYIFTEIIQSPFEWISDTMVVVLRLIIGCGMTGILCSYYYRERHAGNGRIFFFRIINIVWATQCFYMFLSSFGES